MSSTLKKSVGGITSRARTAARTAATSTGRQVLSKVLNYYKLDSNDKRNLINAYNKYWNARTNTRTSNARQNARLAGAKFSNVVFRMYNKQVSKKTAVSSGLQNGVYHSMVYWLPGILVRHTFRRPASI